MPLRTRLAYLALSPLLVVSTAGAQEISRGPFVQNVTQTEATIVWEHTEPTGGTLLIGASADALVEAVEVEPALRHEVRVDGLTSASDVYYRVEPDGGTASDTIAFPTAVAPGEPFRFLVFGDSRTRHDAHARVIEAMSEVEGPRFYLQTGDLVADGEVMEQWDIYFDIEIGLMSRLPVYPAIGNHDEHEGRADNYIDLFALPAESGTEAYYAFQQGNVFVVVLDGHTENAMPFYECILQYDEFIDDCYDPTQRAWLFETLEQAAVDPTIDHIILAQHIGPYSSLQGRSGSSQMRYLLPYFHEMGVTAILTGHDHYYEHGLSYNGLHYVITGGGGAPLYELSDPSSDPHEVIYNETVDHFIVVDVDGPLMDLSARTVDGRILDEWTIDATPECTRDADCSLADAPEVPESCEDDSEVVPICSIGGRCIARCEGEVDSGEDAGADAGAATDTGADDDTSAPTDAASDDAVETAETGSNGEDDEASDGESGSGAGCSAVPATPAGWLLALAMGLVPLRRRDA